MKYKVGDRVEWLGKSKHEPERPARGLIVGSDSLWLHVVFDDEPYNELNAPKYTRLSHNTNYIKVIPKQLIIVRIK